MDNDRFRVEDSQYEYDEPVSFAICDSGSYIDGMSSIPKNVLWVLETLFDRMQELALEQSLKQLPSIEKYTQTRLSKSQAKELLDEIAVLQLPAGETMLSECIALVRAKVEQCASSNDDVELLIEGP